MSWSGRSPGPPISDAVGPYPLTPIPEDADVEGAFGQLRGTGLVSLVLVSDPFVSPSPAILATAFDSAAPFKDHHIHDRHSPQEFSAHHRYEIRRARRTCETRTFSLRDQLEAWCGLYEELVRRHSISGIQAFGRAHFERLCALDPVAVGAFADGELVSAHLWFVHGGFAYSHLAASSARGYALKASYPVYDHSLRELGEMGIRWIDLGAGAGTGSGTSGLEAFKRGFSHGTRPCHLCCKVLDAARYRELSGERPAGYFPVYRTPDRTGAGPLQGPG